jgi:Tfp pilus assembly protein PilV
MKGTSLKAMRSPLARSGQSLVEAIVAVGITLLVITGLVVLAVGAVRSATLARNRSLAVQYAQEGLEALRSVRDRSFSELPSSGTSRVVWTGSEWGILAGTETIGTYTRSFIPEQISAGKLKILLSVAWADSAGDHTVDLTTYLTDWQ